MTESIVVDGIPIPLPYNKPIECFLTPDWYDVFEHHRQWCIDRCQVGGVYSADWLMPQPYMLGVAKELAKRVKDPKRTADQWAQRVIQHFGLAWLEERMIRGKANAIDVFDEFGRAEEKHG